MAWVEVAASGMSRTNAAKPAVMKGRLRMCLPMGQIEELIQPETGEGMQAGTGKGEQPEHAPVLDEIGAPGQLPQRRDGQCRQLPGQRPGAGGMGEVMDSIGLRPDPR